MNYIKNGFALVGGISMMCVGVTSIAYRKMSPTHVLCIDTSIDNPEKFKYTWIDHYNYPEKSLRQGEKIASKHVPDEGFERDETFIVCYSTIRDEVHQETPLQKRIKY